MNTKNAFTVLELLVGLALVMILLSLAGWYQQYQQQKHTGQVIIAELQQMITLAQLKALQLNSAITICPLNHSGCCSNNWSGIITVFIDVNKKHCLLSDSQILKVAAKPINKGQLNFQGFHSSQFLTLVPLTLHEQQNGTFIYCPSNRNPANYRGLIMSKSGRSRVLLPNDAYFKQNKVC